MQATITRNFRDVNTLSPKVLLTNVIFDNGETFRDHCWVPMTDKIKQFIPRTNKQKNTLQFKAKIKDYQTIGPAKQTLSKIREIVIL